jgi:hypothetical protein
VIDVDGIPEHIRFAACHPNAVLPEPAPETGGVMVRQPSWVLLMTPMPTVSFVDPFGIDADDVPAVVREVRALLATHDRHQSAWTADAGSPLHEALVGEGMTPYTDPPLGPAESCMATVQPPSVAPADGVVVTVASTSDEHRRGADLVADIFDMGPQDRAGLQESWQVRHRLDEEGVPTGYSYLAFLDGELVGVSNAQTFADGFYLGGSGVSPAARGRGVYGAMVAARWDHAVSQGRAALTVEAGAMSRPRLERMGFRVVAEHVVLKDRTSR